MPVTSVGRMPLRGSEAAPASAAAAPPSPVATAAGGVVGHGVTRLKPRPPAHAINAPFFPGAAPPKQETAGAHGAHRGRISIR